MPFEIYVNMIWIKIITAMALSALGGSLLTLEVMWAVKRKRANRRLVEIWREKRNTNRPSTAWDALYFEEQAMQKEAEESQLYAFLFGLGCLYVGGLFLESWVK